MGVRSKPQETPRAKRSALPALLISFALHGLFWLAAFRLRPAQPPLAPDDIQIEIVSAPALEPPPEATAAPPAEEKSPVDPTARRKRAAEPPAGSAAPPEIGAANQKAPAPEAGETTLKMRFPEAPAAPPGLAAGVPLPSAAQLARAGIDLGPPPGMTRAVTEPKESAWTKSMNRRAREAAAKAVVAAGKAPPEAFDLLREIERRYQPSQKLVVELAKSEAGRSREAGRWLGRYLGGFLDHDPSTAGQPFEKDTAFRRAVGNARLDYSARVCLSFGADGVANAEIDGGSKVAELDRLARELVLQAADRRGPGLGGASRACYRFSARLERVPPLPVFFCGLNGDLRPECIFPLKEIASTQVVLDGVELAAQAAPPPPAGP